MDERSVSENMNYVAGKRESCKFGSSSTRYSSILAGNSIKINFSHIETEQIQFIDWQKNILEVYQIVHLGMDVIAEIPIIFGNLHIHLQVSIYLFVYILGSFQNVFRRFSMNK